MIKLLHKIQWRILSIFAILAFTVFLVFSREYGWALYSGVIVLFQLWLVPGELEPLRQEKAVLDLLNRLGGKASREQFEAAIAEASDEWGVYSVEYIENMKEALDRLKRKGRIRDEAAEIQLVQSAPNNSLQGRRP